MRALDRLFTATGGPAGALACLMVGGGLVGAAVGARAAYLRPYDTFAFTVAHHAIAFAAIAPPAVLLAPLWLPGLCASSAWYAGRRFARTSHERRRRDPAAGWLPTDLPLP